MCIHMNIHVFVCMCTNTYVHIYMYVCTFKEQHRKAEKVLADMKAKEKITGKATFINIQRLGPGKTWRRSSER